MTSDGPRGGDPPAESGAESPDGTATAGVESAPTGPRAPRVMAVEDNPGDARLLREAFGECGREVDLTVVGDGATAIRRLRDEGTPLPSLVVLDRDLPAATGEEVLDALRDDPRLRHLPVVVFTTSDVPEHVRRMYERRANAYVTKPRDAAGFFERIERLDAFWFAEATLPEDGPE